MSKNLLRAAGKGKMEENDDDNLNKFKIDVLKLISVDADYIYYFIVNERKIAITDCKLKFKN